MNQPTYRKAGRPGSGGSNEEQYTREVKNKLAATDQALLLLTGEKNRILVVQVACALAMKGITRVRASEISERLITEYGESVRSSVVGQVLVRLKIGTVTSQGRRSYVLEEARLLSIQGRLEKYIETMAPRIEETIHQFGDVAVRVGDLEERLVEVQRLASREQEVRQYLRDNGMLIQQVEARENQYTRLKEADARMKSLEIASEQLQAKVESLPSLEERKKKLEDSLRRHEAKVKEIDQKESALAKGVTQIKTRTRGLALVQIEEEIEAAAKELEELKEQLGEKRSLVARLFGGKPGGG